MTHLIALVSVIGIASTAVILGTDTFFLTVGRPALRLASPSAATEVMGFLHLYGDRCMPAWGVLGIFSNLFLALLGGPIHRATYLVSLSLLILFVAAYNHYSKPINRLQTEAAKTARTPDNARLLQASWDRSLIIRVPLLAASLLVQCVALLSASGGSTL
jgi:Domain of unknown function (DUF1772)